MRKLSLHREGDEVRICRLNGSGAFKKRLLEMGFTKNVSLHIVKYAPLNDPMEVVIKNCHVSLRVCEAAQIDVEYLK